MPFEKVPMPRMMMAKLPGCEPYVITKSWRQLHQVAQFSDVAALQYR